MSGYSKFISHSSNADLLSMYFTFSSRAQSDFILYSQQPCQADWVEKKEKPKITH